MKSTARIVIALLLLCAAVLSGCQSRDNGKTADVTTPQESASASDRTTEPTPSSDSNSPQPDENGVDLSQWLYSDTVDVKNSEGTYRISAYYHTNEYGESDKFLVAYSREGASDSTVILTIPSIGDYEPSKTKPVLFVQDVTFDGEPDVLMAGIEIGYGGYHFYPLVWDANEKSFVHAAGFATRTGFILDEENRCILWGASRSQIVEHEIFVYNEEEHRFVLRRHLICSPEDSEEGNSNLVVEEYNYEVGETPIKKIVVPSGAMTNEGKTDQTAEYFGADSVWDLDSDRWHSSIPFEEWHQKIREKQ